MVETPPPPVVEEPPVKVSPPIAKSVTTKTVREDASASAPSKRPDSLSEKALKAQLLKLSEDIEASPLYANDKRHKGLSRQTALNTVNRFITRLENAEGVQERALILEDLRDWRATYLK
ncbi:hypothetical protein D7V88_33965 [Corallococcus terminator]|uniref:Uncharacterized protein n=1 Tax=Corallococcus terminator TaxID=2316733 RepID=A0A3A8HVB4_9BACT|nr:hypothetical protein D7V88_33965 [Corallococcus terminator]